MNKSTEDKTITIHIPLIFQKRGARKTVVTPDGSTWAPRPRVDNAMVKALARAFRWQRVLDDGACGSMGELAGREKVTKSFMSRVLRLTLLAPDVVEAILDGRQPEGTRLEGLLEGYPAEWNDQRTRLGLTPSGLDTPDRKITSRGFPAQVTRAERRVERAAAQQ